MKLPFSFACVIAISAVPPTHATFQDLVGTLDRVLAKADQAAIDVPIDVVHHETGETVPPYQGSIVPRPGDIIALGPPAATRTKAGR